MILLTNDAGAMIVLFLTVLGLLLAFSVGLHFVVLHLLHTSTAVDRFMVYHKKRSPVLYWFSMLLLFALNTFVVGCFWTWAIS